MHARTHAHTHTRTHTCTHAHTHTQFNGSLDSVWDKPSEPVSEETLTDSQLSWSCQPLRFSSIYYDPWHPPCSIYMSDSLFPQSLIKFSLVYLLVCHPPLHILYVSSPNHCLLFATHAHTITASFAVVPRLCHLILVSH